MGMALSLEELPGWPALAAVGIAGASLASRGRGRWLAWAAAGFALACAQGERLLATDWPCARDRERIVVSGTVASPAERRAGRIDFDLSTDDASRRLGAPSKLRLSWYEPTAMPEPGEAWRFDVRLRCRNGFANPGGYDRELALLRDGYGATGYLAGDAGRPLGTGRPAPIEGARAWVAREIEKAAGHTRSVGVMQGLAVGLRGSIPEELQDAFVATGTAHLIAISGMHVTAFALVVLLLSRLARRFLGGPRLSARWPMLQSLLVVAVTAAYGWLAGASLPTLRTVAMVAIFAALRVSRRFTDPAAGLAGAAVVVLAFDPLAVSSAGFWLSFAAVAALVALAAAPPGAAALVRSFVRSQAAVTVMLIPVLAAAFGSISVVGPLANALAIPSFTLLLLPATLAGTALLPVWPVLAAGTWSALGEALDLGCEGLLAMAAWPHATFSPPEPPGWLLAASLAAAGLALAVPGPGCKWLAASVLGSLLLRPGSGPSQGDFDVVMLDVGHGLAAVVRTEQHVLVFDTGPAWRSGGAAARFTLVPYLRSIGARAVDTVVLRHPDQDHAGGFDTLVRALPVGRVLAEQDRDLGQPAQPCVAGGTWYWDGVRFEVLHPPAGAVLGDNDRSCALRVDSPAGAALMLADPERRAEQTMLGRNLSAEVVLVPHHGSASSSSPALVAAVGAKVALVSNGFGNRWGLPREDVVHRWSESGARVLTTAEGGALTVRFRRGAAEPEVAAYRDQTRRWWRRRD